MNIKNIKTLVVVGLSSLLLFNLTSCLGDKVPANKIVEEVLSFGTKDKDIKVVAKEGYSFYIKITTPAAWQIDITPVEAKSWISLDRANGLDAVKDEGINVVVKENIGEARSATLTIKSNNEEQSLIISQGGKASSKPETGKETPENPETGKEKPENPDKKVDVTKGGAQKTGEALKGEHILSDYTDLLEIPELQGGKDNYFYTHVTKDGIVNYSMEYDVVKHHSRWVAFQFNADTKAKNVSRTEDWGWHSKIPGSFSTDNWFRRTGFDRGHLASSADRSFSREANQQTFDYANMSPQIGKLFNQGYYAKLENRVQDWARSNRFCDVLYVAKGGTIRDDQVWDKKIRNKMVIPNYYFMALVVKKGDKYHGLAFWMEHREYRQGTYWPSFRDLTCSIDELEQKTGINFFCNFPDDIENQIESEDANSHKWPGL